MRRTVALELALVLLIAGCAQATTGQDAGPTEGPPVSATRHTDQPTTPDLVTTLTRPPLAPTRVEAATNDPLAPSAEPQTAQAGSRLVLPEEMTAGVRSLAVSGDIAIAVGQGIWVSHDLRTWESAEMRGLPDTSSDRLLDVAIGEGGIVVVGLADAVLFSDEGRDWKRVALPTGSSLRADTETSVLATDQATSVVVGGPGFVAVGTHMWISRDGRNWSVAKIGHPFGHRTHLATNGRSLLVLDGDDVWISADGEDWIEHPGAVPAVETGSEATCPGRRPEQINALLGTTDGYFLTEGLPVRFGGPGMVWRSEDGIHWSQVTLPESGKSSAGVLALAHDEGRYVALIVDDQVLTSIAGGPVIAWTPEGLGVVRR